MKRKTYYYVEDRRAHSRAKAVHIKSSAELLEEWLEHHPQMAAYAVGAVVIGLVLALFSVIRVYESTGARWCLFG